MIPWTFEHNLVHETTEGETTASAELQHWLSQFPVLISKAKSKTGCQREENNVYFIDSPSILPMFCPHLQPPLPAPAGLHGWDEPGGEGRVCRAEGGSRKASSPTRSSRCHSTAWLCVTVQYSQRSASSGAEGQFGHNFSCISSLFQDSLKPTPTLLPSPALGPQNLDKITLKFSHSTLRASVWNSHYSETDVGMQQWN